MGGRLLYCKTFAQGWANAHTATPGHDTTQLYSTTQLENKKQQLNLCQGGWAAAAASDDGDSCVSVKSAHEKPADLQSNCNSGLVVRF